MALPPDLIFFHILPRLPAKSLYRFTCVSKEWNSIVRTPGFLKLHRHHVINDDHQYHQQLLILPNNRPWEFHTMDCETPNDGLTASRPVPFKVRSGLKLSTVTSLHGMVCVGLYTYSVISDLILWNPTTGDYKTLSKTGSHKVCYERYGNKFGLSYSSSEDDYKLVCVTRRPSNVYIYSLKSDSWRNVESTGWCSNSTVSYPSVLPSFLLNEKLYFLFNIYSIMTFDTKTEKLRDLGAPPFINQSTDCIGLVAVRGCIYFCAAIRNSVLQYHTIELWRMDGDGDWTKVETSSPKLGHLSYSNYPRHLMGNGNWLIFSRSEENVYVVDVKTHTKDIICSIPIAFHPEGTYMETLVSPNQYIIE